MNGKIKGIEALLTNTQKLMSQTLIRNPGWRGQLVECRME